MKKFGSFLMVFGAIVTCIPDVIFAALGVIMVLVGLLLNKEPSKGGKITSIIFAAIGILVGVICMALNSLSGNISITIIVKLNALVNGIIVAVANIINIVLISVLGKKKQAE